MLVVVQVLDLDLSVLPEPAHRRQGQQAADKGDWDLAVARYTKALQKDPNNIRFKITNLNWPRIDQHPPLYYLLLHYWIALNGDTPYYARLLSALFDTGTILLAFFLGRQLMNRDTGLLAAFHCHRV